MIQQHESPHHTDDILWHETAGWVKFLVDGGPPEYYTYIYLSREIYRRTHTTRGFLVISCLQWWVIKLATAAEANTFSLTPLLPHQNRLIMESGLISVPMMDNLDVYFID